MPLFPVRQTSATYTPCSLVPMTPADRRALLLGGIDVVIDVGANEGQYATWLRALGFSRRIISFEPQTSAFQVLSTAASRDDSWECHQFAIGPSDSELDLHLALDSGATTVLQPTAENLRSFPDNHTIGNERVPMRTLTSLWSTLGCVGGIYLKIDVEGYELSVLEGADRILQAVSMIELEMSIAPMYRDAPLIQDVFSSLRERGFLVIAIEQNGGDERDTGHQLMCDGIFRNTRAI